MGCDPSGTLCFGYAYFDESYPFPWDRYGEEEWWRDVNGYENPFPYPYDEFGWLNEGITEEDVGRYFTYRREWDKKNPLPIEVVTCYSSAYPCGYVLTLKSVLAKTLDGGPDKVDVKALLQEEEGAYHLLKTFCEAYGIEVEGAPDWYLTSYYG